MKIGKGLEPHITRCLQNLVSKTDFRGAPILNVKCYLDHPIRKNVYNLWSTVEIDVTMKTYEDE